MKLKLEIRVLSPSGEPIELTLEEAKELYVTLGEIFGEKKESLGFSHPTTPGVR